MVRKPLACIVMNPGMILINRHISDFFAVTVVCVLLLMAGLGATSSLTGSEPAADVNNIAEDCNGPTVMLDFSRDGLKKNPLASFMYFVPLISPILIERETSADNRQQVGIISYRKKVDSKSFYVSCEFKISGKGFHRNIFDPSGMIARNIPDVKEGEPLTDMLDYIKFEGEGLGRIVVKGTIAGSVETVTGIDMHFSATDQKSPVTIGLYSVSPENGQYNYENRYDELVVRVSTLAFKKSESSPRMGIKVASVNKKTRPDSWWGDIKGIIANFFIKPVEVDKHGNDTMLNFGYALLKEKSTFTFPKAKNIRETGTVATNDKQR